jgi:hypothetical protein
MTDYYVDPVNGNDANAGTSEGSGNAWKTLGKAATVTIAGDTVWCKNNADYAEQLTITVLGSGANPITWIGYTSTPGDGGKATITGSSSRSYCVIGSNESYYSWINFIFRDSTNNLYNDAGADWVTFHNCDFINGYSAISVDNSCVVVNCTFQNNGNYPITADLYLCCINNYFKGTAVSLPTTSLTSVGARTPPSLG